MEGFPRVGRKDELRQLLTAVRDADNEKGSVVLIRGRSGMGKSALIQLLEITTLQSSSEFPNLEIAVGTCRAISGPTNPYEPFKEILLELAAPKRDKNFRQHLQRLLRDVAPDLLTFIPALTEDAPVGVGAGTEGAAIISDSVLQADPGTRSDLTDSILRQYTDTILGLTRNQRSIVLIIEDAHWIDSASMELIDRLSSSLASSRLVLVLTYRPDLVEKGSGLDRLRRMLVGRGLARTIGVEGLSVEEVQLIVDQRYISDFTHGRLAAWLHHRSRGHPMFILQYIRLLEERNIIRKAGSGYYLHGRLIQEDGKWRLETPEGSLPVPESVQELLRERLEQIEEKGRQLLELGSVQGQSFMSLVLAKLSLIAPEEVSTQLELIRREQGAILEGRREHWHPEDADIYEFEHALLQEVLYEDLSRQQRRRYHITVAQFMASLLNTVREKEMPVPRRLLLDIAHHHRAAGKMALAARSTVAAAESCYREGAFREASTLSRLALKDLSEVAEPQNEDDVARAAATRMLLATSEPQLGGWPGEDLGDLEGPIVAGLTAAQRTGDRGLLAQLHVLNGKYLVARGRLSDAVEELSMGAEQLREDGDVFGELCALVELGHRQMGIQAALGVKTLQQASAVLDREEATLRELAPLAALNRLRGRIEGSIGVAELDHGHFDTAIEVLQRSVTRLQQDKMYDFSAMHSNFLGQALVATGRFEEAEQVLRDAIGLLGGEAESSPQTAYNLGLLGKLYLEWGRVDDAAAPLNEGWRQIQRMPTNNLLPLVAAYFAELLITQSNANSDGRIEAERILNDALRHSLRTEFARSVVMTRSLLARLHLDESHPRLALAFSKAAADQLWEAQLLPAVRAEEVYYIHARVLNANGKREEARRWLHRAWAVLQSKAQSIGDGSRRVMFLERVNVSREIIQAVEAQGGV